MTDPEPDTTELVPGATAHTLQASAVARGGAANLFGAIVYGASNFVVLIVLNRIVGIRSAGIVVVAIALFSITSTMSGLGCSTGLIRMISRDRATGHTERLPATVRIAVVPVGVVSVIVAVIAFLFSEPIADLLSNGREVAEVAAVLRAMAPFIPAATMHTVLVQATRGFDTMLPQVVIERVGRAISLPVVVAVAATAGMGPRGVGAAWAATNVVALLFSARALQTRVNRAVLASGRTPTPINRTSRRDYWAFTAPRAVGQASEVAVNWLDTIIVSAIVSTTAAGIYASGSRYLLPGLFAAEALMQVTGPRISGLLALRKQHEASALLQVVAGWQVSVMWPLYLLIIAFPSPLLRVFGPEVVAAKGALIALAIAMLIASPIGPAASAILMSGRSTQAMFNTLVVLAVNVIGNLLLVPRYGITAAGIVWGATILVAAALPGWQCRELLGVSTIGRPALQAAGLAAATVGLASLAFRVLFGDAVGGLLAAVSVGGAMYVVGLRVLRSQLHLNALWEGISRRTGNESGHENNAPRR